MGLHLGKVKNININLFTINLTGGPSKWNISLS